MSLEVFDIRKDDSDYLTKKYMSQRVGFDFSDIKIMSKSEQRDVIIKLQQKVFFKLQQSCNIILLAETKSQNQTVIKTILHFEAKPKIMALQ